MTCFEDCPPNWSMIGQVEAHRQPHPSETAKDGVLSQSATSSAALVAELSWDDANLQDGGWVLRVRQRFTNDSECLASCRLLVTFSTAYLAALSVQQGPLYKWLMSKSRQSCRRDSDGRIKMGPLIDSMKKANSKTITRALKALRWCRCVPSCCLNALSGLCS